MKKKTGLLNKLYLGLGMMASIKKTSSLIRIERIQLDDQSMFQIGVITTLFFYFIYPSLKIVFIFEKTILIDDVCCVSSSL